MDHSKCFPFPQSFGCQITFPKTQMATVCTVGMKARGNVLFSKSRLSAVAKVSFPLSSRYFHLHEHKDERGEIQVLGKIRDGNTTWEVRGSAMKRAKGKGRGITLRTFEKTTGRHILISFISKVYKPSQRSHAGN